jgi:Alpha-L-fucosidase
LRKGKGFEGSATCTKFLRFIPPTKLHTMSRLQRAKNLVVCFAIYLLMAPPLQAQSSRKNDFMQWWRDARFGLFIHWGLYSIPAGEWNGETNHAEWIRNTAQIPLATYDQLVHQFNPTKFNADEWVRLAHDAGMKYIVITSKHHDGFALFDSQYSDFDVMATPFKRDILKELAAACRKYNMRLCFYHSIMDWHHPDYLPRREWEKDRSTAGAAFERYVAYMKNQLRELLTNYGNIGVLWFDGEWEGTWTHEHGKDLYQFVKSLQPGIIINNRVDKGREGMQGLTREGGFVGDFGTPEQEIPATGIPGADWESCMTMNNNWGYNRNDHNWKSSETLVRNLIDIASKGGNFLLNVGPTAEGVIPQPSIERLRDIGAWMKVNGAAIYGTSASPFRKLSWGRCTQKKHKNTTTLYMHVFNWPADHQLVIPGLGNDIVRAYTLAGNQPVTCSRHEADYIINLHGVQQQPYATVIAIEIKGEPVVYAEPDITAPSTIFTDQLPVSISSVIPGAVVRYTTDGTEPTEKSFVASAPIYINQSVTIKAKCFLNNKPVTATTTASFQKVVPAPATRVTSVKPGLQYEVFEGKWSRLPDFATLTPVLGGTVSTVDISARQGKEAFGFVFEGYIEIPQDGVYTFYLTSDDGSKLIIDDAVIDNDGLHSAVEKHAELPLAKGYHTFRLYFFENSGGEELQVSWKGPGFEKEPLPATVLFH